MAKIKFQKPKGQRIKNRFMGITSFQVEYWYNYESKKWEHYEKSTKGGKSSHQPCKSYKAFVRKLKKAPKGIEFILVSRFVGYDISCVSF